MAERVASLYAEIGLEGQGLTRGLRDARRGLEQTGQKTREFEKTVALAEQQALKLGMALTAAGVGGLAFLGSATRLAARVETLGVVVDVLGRNVGHTRGEMRQFEKDIVSQGITLRSTRESMALMAQANIDLARGTDLARLAQDAAVISNENSSESFRKLVYIIQTGNLLMARRLGLVLDFQGAYKREAEASGRAVTSLTAQEKVQIRLNEVMSAGANIAGTYEAAMGTAGKQMLSLERHIEETRRILGETFLPVLANSVEGVTNFLKAFQDLPATQQASIAATIGFTSALLAVGGTALMVITRIPKLIAGIKALNLVMGGALGPVGLIVTALYTLGVTGVQASASIKTAARSEEELRDQLRRGEITYKEYIDSFIELSDKWSQWAVIGGRITLVTEETANAWRIWNEEIELHRQLRLGQDLETTAEEMERMARAGGALAEAEFLVGLDLTGEAEQVEQSIQDLTSRATELGEEIARLEGLSWLSQAQKDQLQDAQDELGEIPGQIAEIEAAWDRQTKMFLINMMQQRIAFMGLTGDELTAAQDAIAGIMGAWGLMPDGVSTIYDQVVLGMSILETEGVDSFTRFMDMVLGQAARMPSEFPLNFIITQEGRIPIGAGLGGDSEATESAVGTHIPLRLGGLPSFQHGGLIEGAGLVGEAGPELFVPHVSGQIIPRDMLSLASRYGAGPAQGKVQAETKAIIQKQAQQTAAIQRSVSAIPAHIAQQTMGRQIIEEQQARAANERMMANMQLELRSIAAAMREMPWEFATAIESKLAVLVG